MAELASSGEEGRPPVSPGILVAFLLCELSPHFYLALTSLPSTYLCMCVLTGLLHVHKEDTNEGDQVTFTAVPSAPVKSSLEWRGGLYAVKVKCLQSI